MKYYRIQRALSSKMDSETMVQGYDYGAADSVYHWRENHLSPNLFSVKLNRGVVPKDIVECAPASDADVLIISDDLYIVLLSYNISTHDLAPVRIVGTKDVYTNYHYLYFKTGISEDLIDFGKSLFHYDKFENGRWVKLDIIPTISCIGDIKEKKIDGLSGPNLTHLSFTSDMTYDVFYLAIWAKHVIVVTEAVKRACEETGIKGVAFVELPFSRNES